MNGPLIFFSVMIALAGAIDAFVSLKTDLQPMDELNPLARWVLSHLGLKAFVALKCLGTAVSLAAIWALESVSPGMAVAVAAPVALFMAWVVWFLATY